MPNTKLTREKLKVHFHYSRMIYLIVVVLAVLAAPILSEGDLLGSVLMIGQDPLPPTSETEYKLVQTISAFLGRHMES